MQKAVIVDDIDGSEGAETVKFGLDGQFYEIDLAEDNLTKLREVMAPYVNAARKDDLVAKTTHRANRRGATPRAKRATTYTSAADQDTDAEADVPATATVTAIDPQERRPDIRTWASGRGLTIGARGRIAKAIVDKYEAEMAKVG